MVLERDAIGWVLVLVIFSVVAIVIMLMRNRAAKTDKVVRTDKDAESPNLSKDLQKDTQKLD